ncbi:hypothetical protein EK0264_07270 [Epidermidibacterium keratini]|uniref:Uncharacterized protein n=1 Tax=Epidermidibacterium keratini TaxID=1891644 RepID=A0A7L4YMN1_9ACTN|nr:DUF6403 family protein [Epidermidibacterium keratini]QHC00094.1 hypothetical protein EK0264_07270 [Epidermidibacterium keratini]
MSAWIVWTVAIAMLVLAGFIAATRSRAAARTRELASEMARARRAIALAEASRDTYPGQLAKADVLLDQATGLLSGNDDPATAIRARELAEQADELWRVTGSDT